MAVFGRLYVNKQWRGVVSITDVDGITYKSTYFEDMLSQVKAYRMGNGGDLLPGWEHRIGTMIVEQNPEQTKNCSVPAKEANYRTNVALGDVKNFFGTVKKWILRGGKCVEPEVANERAQICAGCPHNQEIVGCAKCSQLIPNLMKLIGNKTTPYDSQLEGCNRCACQLKAKVHLPEDVLAGGRTLPLPSFCWLKGVADEQED